MNMITLWVALSFVVEKVVEFIQTIFPVFVRLDEKYPDVKLNLILAVGISMVLAFGARLDFFEMLNVEFHLPYVGTTLSGFLMGAGSGFLHTVLEGIKNLHYDKESLMKND